MLFKERMLNRLLQSIEQRLDKKPFTWMSWWRGKKWSSVFSIIPELEKCPLWKRDEASLSSLRLFDLEPQALHTELQRYWKRPFWQRWWLSLFTSINNKRKAYAYYQRCLAFAEVQKQPGYTSSVFRIGQERAILLELVAWFDQDIKYGEKILEQHAGDLNWLQNRFTSILSQYEQKREREFLKRLEKKLNKLPIIRIRSSVRSRIKKEYQELGKLMRDYLLSILFRPDQVSAHNEGATAFSVAYEATEDSVVSDSRELVYVGPAVATRNTLGMYPSGKTCLTGIDSVGNWVSVQREAIASLLAEGRDAEIKTLLEQSLNNIRDIITPPIESYQERVTEVRQGKVGYEVAIECSEDLQRRLIRFFRNSVLLFHPDKSDRNEELRCLQTELFKEFKQLSDTSLETISAGLQTLKQCIPKWKLEHQAILGKMQRDREAFRARLKKEMKTIAESNAKLNASLKEVIEESKQYREEMKQDRERMKQYRKEMKQSREKMRKQIECIKNDLLAQNLGVNQDPMPEERPGTSPDFFTRPAP